MSSSQGAAVHGNGFFIDLQGDDEVNGGVWSQAHSFAGGVAAHFNIGGNDAYSSKHSSRGYTRTCWEILYDIPVPDCPAGIEDFAAVFLDICGTDTYAGWVGDNDLFWTQNMFGHGADLRDGQLCAGNE